jgi:hypothetical protein
MRDRVTAGRRRPRTLGAVVAVAGLTASGLAGVQPAVAAQDSTVEQAGAAATTWRIRLHELSTRGNRGWFYTVNPAEYWRARRAGFGASRQYLGHMARANIAVRGTLPVYRLRSKVRPAYLVTWSAAERNRLVASRQFVYEGVLGRTATTGGSNKIRIYRVSKAGYGWRVATTTVARALIAQGWHLDGNLGYTWIYK